MTLIVPCALCAATETRLVVQKFGNEIAKCVRCGLVYANPRMPTASILARYSAQYFWDEYLPANGAKEGKIDLQYLDDRYRLLLQLLHAQVGQVGQLLEIGAGAGFFLKAAQRAGWQVSGLELSTEAATYAQQELGLAVTQQTAEQYAYPEQGVDVIAMLEVIEHLFEPRRVLESAHRGLRPGGLLLISTPNFNAFSRWALGESWAVLSPGEHLYYFTEKTLRALLLAAGFTAVHFYRTFPGWGVFETLNPNYTHAPTSARTKQYRELVTHWGKWFYGSVQALGWADTLLCVAYKKATP